MSRRDKLLIRFLSRPTDFTFDELVTLMARFGYHDAKGGHAGGSRVSFTDGKGDYIRIHKPHPRNELKLYQIDDITQALKDRGLI